MIKFNSEFISNRKFTSIKINTLKAFKAGCNLVLHCNGNMKEMNQVAENSPPIDNFIIKKTSDDSTVETIDGISVSLINVLEMLGQRDFYDQDELMQKLCYKYDKNREFKIIPVFEKKVADYWMYKV